MDVAAIATVVSAACSLAEAVRLARGHDSGPWPNADIVKPAEVSISDSAFAEITTDFYNTFDAAELHSISVRLAACRQRFIKTGDGKARQECICNVLRQVAAGNNGSLPGTDDWNETFTQLCSERPGAPTSSQVKQRLS